jgi:Rrf2 family protein
VHVSVRTRYAIKAVLRLAIGFGGPPVHAREIARFGGIPPKFLDQVMADLRQAGLVIGRRGKGGGYLLARDPGEVSFADVFEAVEGSWGGLSRMPATDEAEALVEPVWADVRRATREILTAADFADVAAKADDATMYYI